MVKEQKEREMHDPKEQLAGWICEAECIVVFTGAGMSTESGIPDFRSPGGIWTRYNPDDFVFQRFLASEEARERYWEMSTELYQVLKQAKPNAGHLAIAHLEVLGKLDCVITQNIDGLHQAAGNNPNKVIELHGTALAVTCVKCGAPYDRDDIQLRLTRGLSAPQCDLCQGPLKPATISFGQQMPEQETLEAFRRTKKADLFIVVGSSLVVQPAASLPLSARENGGRLVIVNRDATPLDPLADLILRGSAGEALADVVQRVQRRLE
jgi:NAD-dependent deacetylase